MTAKKYNQGALAAIESGIAEADRQALRKFNGISGSLPAGASKLVVNIAESMRSYLLVDRGLSKQQVLALLTGTPRQALLKCPLRRDEGVRVAIRVLHSILSGTRPNSGGFVRKGRALSVERAQTLMFSGSDGLIGAGVRGGGKKGSEAAHGTAVNRSKKYSEMQAALDSSASDHPKSSRRALEILVAKQFQCSEKTIRRHTKFTPKGKTS